MRGPGEFFGTRQSGLPDLRMAKISDVAILEMARNEAIGYSGSTRGWKEKNTKHYRRKWRVSGRAPASGVKKKSRILSGGPSGTGRMGVSPSLAHGEFVDLSS